MTKTTTKKLPESVESPRPSAALIAGSLVILAVMAFVYWPSLRILWGAWQRPDYSHGYLVPLFSGFLLWVRRDMLQGVRLSGSRWGFALLAFSALLFVGFGYLGFNLIIAFSLIPCIAGIVLLVGGWRALNWSWPGIVFLVFMIPLPMGVEGMATLPLRRIGTIISTFVLQTIGLQAVSQGNVISLAEHDIGVADACSGLRMLMSSTALAFGLVFIIKRPLWERAIILVSAVPIALITNVVRITVTGVCYEYAGPEMAERVFHDFAGWMMMPMAVGLLWLELAILSRLLVEPDQGPTLIQTLRAQG